jgi:DNA-binding MarR family transcriptional regulator
MQVNDTWVPQTPVEGVLHAFTRIGRRLKSKQQGDTIDHSAHLVMYMLLCAGPIRLSDLAARMEIDASTASRHIRALEQAGLVHRSADPDDGRAFRVELTEDGARQTEADRRRRLELLSQAMEGWDAADVETFEKLMTRFADGVSRIADERADRARQPVAAPQNTEKNVEN